MMPSSLIDELLAIPNRRDGRDDKRSENVLILCLVGYFFIENLVSSIMMNWIYYNRMGKQ